MENVKDLTEKEIEQGAFNVLKKGFISRVSANEEKAKELEHDLRKILSLDCKEYNKKISSTFLYEILTESESYVQVWLTLLEKCNSLEELVMTLHYYYGMREGIEKMRRQDPLESLMEIMLRMKK